MPDWRRLSLSDKAAWVIGSGFGAGFSPIAPGTVGSLAAAVLYGLSSLTIVSAVLLIMVGLVVGVWATGRMSTESDPDPGVAVWDEFVGMWIAALPTLLLGWGVGIWWMLIAFLIFRALDVLKPWPCRRLERLHGGWGIMLDDVAAGLMTLVIVSLLFIGLALLLLSEGRS